MLTASKIMVAAAFVAALAPAQPSQLDSLVAQVRSESSQGHWANVAAAARQALVIDPSNVLCLFWLANVTPNLDPTAAGVLDDGERAANGLLALARPANIKEADWPETKRSLDTAAHRTLGWIAVRRKSDDVAYQEFEKTLFLDPTQAQVSYWLAQLILGQNRPERVSEGIYHVARAAAYAGPNSIAPKERAAIDSYLTDVYTRLHGNTFGLDELKAAASVNALPPYGFHIASAAEAAPPPAIGSVYVSSLDASDQLQVQLAAKTFTLHEHGQDFSGTFTVNGKTLCLHIAQLNTDADIAIDGPRLIVSEGEIWLQPNAAPAPPQQTPPPQPQADDGVWVDIYGTCPSGDLVIFRPTIYANDVELAKLACNTYFYVAARPGTYKFCATKGKCATAAIGASGPYYFRVTPTALSYKIGLVDASVAEDELHDASMTALDLSRVLAPKMVVSSTANPPAVFLTPK